MEPARWDELVEIMGQLADGDETAAFALYERFGDKVGGTVRAVLRTRRLTLVRDEDDGGVGGAGAGGVPGAGADASTGGTSGAAGTTTGGTGGGGAGGSGGSA